LQIFIFLDYASCKLHEEIRYITIEGNNDNSSNHSIHKCTYIHVKYLSFLLSFNQTWIFLNRFW